jgi:hypothetical protein
MNASLGRLWIIRHHTAIILIVWSILFPPLVTRSGVIYMEPNAVAPLTEWRAMQQDKGTTFDSERNCEDARSTMISEAKNLLRGAPADIEKMPLENSQNGANWVFALEASKSRCIAGDDPRLRAK